MLQIGEEWPRLLKRVFNLCRGMSFREQVEYVLVQTDTLPLCLAVQGFVQTPRNPQYELATEVLNLTRLWNRLTGINATLDPQFLGLVKAAQSGFDRLAKTHAAG